MKSKTNPGRSRKASAKTAIRETELNIFNTLVQSSLCLRTCMDSCEPEQEFYGNLAAAHAAADDALVHYSLFLAGNDEETARVMLRDSGLEDLSTLF